MISIIGETQYTSVITHSEMYTVNIVIHIPAHLNTHTHTHLIHTLSDTCTIN